MKHLILLALLTLNSSLLTLQAALPVKWDVELTAQPPQVFSLQRPRGETYELEAVLKRHGKPFAPAITNACIYWQTNGMENLYWSAPASVSNNFLRATWLPSMDPGSTTVRGYIGDPGHIYAAAFQLRFIASPGATPNELPLPQKVIDFAKVTVLNPPWSGGGGGGVDTNAVRDIVRETVDGAARLLPKYLHALDFYDSYPEAAHEYYSSRGNGKTDGGCSSVRDGGFLYRNFDYPFDERAEFIVRMSAGPAIEQSNNPNNRTIRHRFASVGVAQVGTNLTEQIVTSGKPSRWYKALPGATVDGINEKGVACNINVVDGPVTNGWHTTGNLHPLGAIRWILDHATNAQHGAEYIAANIRFPQGWEQNFHYMIADATSTYIVENGSAHAITKGVPTLTNFRLYPTRDTTGAGQERYDLLLGVSNITNAWYTRAYLRSTTPYWYSEFHSDDFWHIAVTEWAKKPKEEHRGESFDGESWWQTVHTSVYDISNLTLRVAVQEVDDWYVFQVPSSGGLNQDAVREIVHPMIGAATNGLRRVDDLAVYERKWQWYSDSQEYASRLMEFRTAPDVNISYLPYFDRNIGKWDLPSHSAEFGAISATWTSGNETDQSAEVLETFYVPYGTAITNVLIYKLVSVPGSDLLATTNGVNAAIEANEATGTDRQVIRGEQESDGTWDIHVQEARTAYSAVEADAVYWENVVYKPTWFDSYGLVEAYINQDPSQNLWKRFKVNKIGSETGTEDLPEYLGSGEWNTSGDKFAKVSQIPVISATDTTFSNAVLAVGLNIDTNAVIALNGILADTNVVAVIGEIAGWPVDQTTGATTIGSLLAALAAAVYFLKRKTSLIESDGKASETFATDLLGKQVANAKVRYALATTASAAMADRTVNLYEMNGNGTITFPTATTHEGVTYARDFLLRVKVTTAGSLTLPTDVTPLGDSFDFTKANDWLIAFTEIGKDANNKAEFYIRAISLEG